VACGRHGPDPRETADDVVEGELPVVHPGDAGDIRREGPYEGCKPGEDNGHPAVLLIKGARRQQVLLLDEPEVSTFKDLFGGFAAEVIVDGVAEDRRRAQAEVQEPVVEDVLAGEKSGGE